MNDAGLGDEGIRDQIATLDERIKSIEMSGGSVRALKVDRKGLMIRLATEAPDQELRLREQRPSSQMPSRLTRRLKLNRSR